MSLDRFVQPALQNSSPPGRDPDDGALGSALPRLHPLGLDQTGVHKAAHRSVHHGPGHLVDPTDGAITGDQSGQRKAMGGSLRDQTQDHVFGQ